MISIKNNKKIKNFISKINKAKEYFNKKNTQNKEDIIAPCVGDIIEYEDGSREVVSSVVIENEQYQVRFVKGARRTSDAKGRSFWTPVVSSKPEIWPPTNVKILRDGSVLYPQSEWKLDLIIWLSNKVLK